VLGSVPCVFDVDAVPPGLTHGAAVAFSGDSGVEDAHGARVGWFGPLGTAGPWPRRGTRADTHGAAVPLAGGIPLLLLLVDIPGSASGSRSAGVCFDDDALDLGWLDVCTLAWICLAAASFSQANIDPKGKCCTTGNLDSTSAWYIFSMPCHTVRVLDIRRRLALLY